MNIEKIRENAVTPTRGTKYSAGLDLTPIHYTIRPNGIIIFGTCIKVEIPEGYFGGLYIRSGIAKKGIWALANSPGVIDSDYRGEVFIMLRYLKSLTNINREENSLADMLSKEADKLLNTRVAQLIIQPYAHEALFQDGVNETARGKGGFGSTGK